MRCIFLLILLFSSLCAKELTYEIFHEEEIKPHLKKIKALCDKIYCESPFLHSGHDAGYEPYLNLYTKAKDSIICLAYDDKKVVGVAAGLPLSYADQVFKQPLKDHAHDIDSLYFLGEFGLHPDYQGKDYADKLFKQVESWAKEKGQYHMICFWEIEDITTPTQKPPGTVIHDDFWKKIGFTCYPKLNFLMFWTNVQETQESPHMAIYWTKKL
jgi:GNAT superfamily N-acetyltransferase